MDIYTYTEACAKAEVWFTECARKAHLVATGEVISDQAYTVKNALDDMIADYEKHNRDVQTIRTYSRSRILPELGTIEVGNLTRTKIRDWHLALAKSPRMLTGQGTSKYRDEWETDPTEDQLRARKSTANRVLAILKRALTLSIEEGKYSGQSPWREVKPFRKVKGQRLRFLTEEEQGLLLDACPPDFRNMVLAALHTGSRYGPLRRMEVRDFNPKARTVWISRDKGDTSRHVVLSDDAVEWFKSMVEGKEPSDLLLLRSSVRRITRKSGRTNAWEDDDQITAMEKAYTEAEIEPLAFHELRHTYASGLIAAGVPLLYIAKQLGHANTRMVEEHYGHLAPNALADSIRRLSPKVPSPGMPKVATLKLKKAT